MIVTREVRGLTEQELGALRDTALKLLRENQGQAREGIEWLVRDRLSKVAAAVRPQDSVLSPEQMEHLHQELLDLGFVMFSLGYTVAHTHPRDPLTKP